MRQSSCLYVVRCRPPPAPGPQVPSGGAVRPMRRRVGGAGARAPTRPTHLRGLPARATAEHGRASKAVDDGQTHHDPTVESRHDDGIQTGEHSAGPRFQQNGAGGPTASALPDPQCQMLAAQPAEGRGREGAAPCGRRAATAAVPGLGMDPLEPCRPLCPGRGGRGAAPGPSAPGGRGVVAAWGAPVWEARAAANATSTTKQCT